MEKIKINLNPKAKNTGNQSLSKFFDYTPLLAIVVVFLALVWLLSGLILLIRVADRNRLTAAWQELRPQNDRLLEIKRQISGLEMKKRNLKAAKLAGEGGVLLENLFLALPENIWLTNLQIKENSVEINGYALIWQEDALVSLERLVNNLAQDVLFGEKFKNIAIRSTRKDEFRGREVVRFFLECKK